jgi:ribosomal-protein-alanine N-acetyltransferase
MTFHLRPINEYDLQQIKHINDLVQQIPWTLNSIISEYERNDFFSQVAVSEEGPVVGYVFVRNIENSLEIMSIGVHPHYFRRGIARSMMDSIIKKASLGGEIFLEVSDINHSAIALYKSLGFSDLSIRQHYYSDGSNALCMKLNLAKT